MLEISCVLATALNHHSRILRNKRMLFAINIDSNFVLYICLPKLIISCPGGEAICQQAHNNR
ncbi:hypothetical protein DsansV1_C30g0213981 [Dioscorea sansibarensis]